MSKRGRPPHPDILTPREWEVLALLREGLSNDAIAQRLVFPPTSVEPILAHRCISPREHAMTVRTAALLGLATLLVLLFTSCSDSTPSDVVPSVTDRDGEESAAASATATVLIGGTIESISDNALVLQDWEGRLVDITIENAEGPGAQFCRQDTPVDHCMILSDAAPTAGEDVCVLARLLPDGELLSWFVNLDADCRFYRPTPVIVGEEEAPSSATIGTVQSCYRKDSRPAFELDPTRSLEGASVAIGNMDVPREQADRLLSLLRHVEPSYFGVRRSPGARIGSLAGPMIDIKLGEGTLRLKYVRRGSVASYGLLFDPARVDSWDFIQLLNPPGYAQSVCAVPPEFDLLMADLGYAGHAAGDILETRLVSVTEAQREHGLIEQIEVWRDGEQRRELSLKPIESLIPITWNALTSPPPDLPFRQPVEPFAGEPLNVEVLFAGIDPFPEAVKPTKYLYYPEDSSGSRRGVLLPVTGTAIYNAGGDLRDPFHPGPALDQLLRVAASGERAE